MNEIINEISQYLTFIEVNKTTANISYMDFSYNENGKEIEIIPNIVTKTINLEIESFVNSLDAKINITNSFLKQIKEHAYLNREESKNDDKYNFDLNISSDILKDKENVITIGRKIIMKIKNASMYIATNGRIGYATTILINPKWLKYNNIIGNIFDTKIENKMYLKKVCDLAGLGIIVLADERIKEDELILFRKNNIYQPGVIGVWSNENCNEFELNYSVVSVSKDVHKQYFAIKI